MANPRLTIRVDEIHSQRVTLDTDSSITYERTKDYGTSHRHKPVKIVGDGQVGLCAAGDIPWGSLDRVEPDGMAVVVWHGAAVFNNANATPLDAGDTDFVADGSGNLVVATGDDVGTGSLKVAVSEALDGKIIILL